MEPPPVSIFLLVSIYSGLIAVCFVIVFALFAREDLKDGNIDNLVAFTMVTTLIGICIAFSTGQFSILIIGLIEPSLLFSAMRIIYKRIKKRHE